MLQPVIPSKNLCKKIATLFIALGLFQAHAMAQSNANNDGFNIDREIVINGVKQIIGEDLNPATSQGNSCVGSCHHTQVSSRFLSTMAISLYRTYDIINSETLSDAEKSAWLIDQMKQESMDNIGMYRAFLYSEKETELLTEAGIDLKFEFERMFMPPLKDLGNEIQPWSQAQIDAVKNWVLSYNGDDAEDKIRQDISKLLDSDSSELEGECTDFISSDYRSHISKMKRFGWQAINRQRGMSMFGCEGDNPNPLSCFDDEQFVDTYNDPSVGIRSTKDWAVTQTAMSRAPESIRFVMLKDLGSTGNSYWTRISPDGRYAATGRRGFDYFDELFVDIPERPDVIKTNGSYDPGFFPDGSGFMFQNSGRFCSIDILNDPQTWSNQLINLNNNNYCSSNSAVDLYQSVSGMLGSPVYFSAYKNGSWSGDPGTGSSDPEAVSSGSVRISLHYTGADGRYAHAASSINIPTPDAGAWFLAPSSLAMIGQIKESALGGYQVRSLDLAVEQDESGRYKFGEDSSSEVVGRVCMRGTKATLSFDERFLVTHHYIDNRDSREYEGDDEFESKKGRTVDIHMADLQTGKKYRITQMPAGYKALYPHFRSDGWLMFMVKGNGKYYYVMSDAALKIARD